MLKFVFQRLLELKFLGGWRMSHLPPMLFVLVSLRLRLHLMRSWLDGGVLVKERDLVVLGMLLKQSVISMFWNQRLPSWL